MTTINLNRINPESSLIIGSGQVSIIDSSDSLSPSSGSLVISGGLGIAKKLYVGSDLSIFGNITSGTWNGSTVSVGYGGTGQNTLTSNGILTGNGTSGILSSGSFTYSSNTLSTPKISSSDITNSTSSSTGSVLVSGGMGVSKNIYLGGGILGMDNSTSNFISFSNNGIGSPTYTSRSSGTKIILGNYLSGSTGDYALGIESGNVWFSTSDSATGGFSWYHGTYNSLLLSPSQLYIKHTTISTGTTSGAVRIDGGVGIAGSTFIGTNLSVGGNCSFGTITSGTWNGNAVSVVYGGTGVSTLVSNSVLLGNGTAGIQSPSDITYSSNTLNLPKISLTNITASTSTTTGSMIVSGGVGIAKNITAGGYLFVNFNGQNAGDGVISISPNINGNVTSISFYQNISNSGASWSIGQKTGAAATNTFGIYSSSLGSNVFTALSAGLIGINTLIPESALHVTGNRIVIPITSGIHNGMVSGSGYSISIVSPDITTNSYIDFTYPNSSTIGRIYYDNTAKSLSFITDNVSKMTISSSGVLSIVSTVSSTSNNSGVLLLSGGIGISSTAESSSPNNGGTLTTSGGIAVAKSGYFGGRIHVNYSGIYNGDGAVKISPGANGLESSISFHQNISEGGASWFIGQNTGAVGSNIFGIYSSSFGNTVTINSSGQASYYATNSSTSSTSGSILISGGIGISNTSDSVSSINGGSFTTAGGVAIAKKLFVGQTASFLNTIDMNITKIINLATPTVSSDAATKLYVDNSVQGLSTKNSVKVTTTVPGILVSSFENGDSIDGYVLVTGDRILIKDQSSGAENGIYIVNSSGIPFRSSDLSSGSNAASSYVFVEQGTINSDSGWTCTNNTGFAVVGTDNLVFTQFSGAGQILAGTGIVKNGNTISVSSSLTFVNALGTITTGLWNASTVAVSYGGTGQTTLNSNSVLLGNGTSGIQSPSSITYSSSTLSLPKISLSDTTNSTSSITGSLVTSGGIGISDVTDSISSTNGGALTIAGGVAIAKTLRVGSSILSTTSENTAIVIDSSSNGRLGLVKKTGILPFFACGSGGSFDFRVSNLTDVSNVSGGTFTSVANINTSGGLTCGLISATAVSSVHSFINNNTGDSVSIKNTNNSGYSNLRFDDDTGSGKFYIGYGNSGSSYASSSYMIYQNQHLVSQAGNIIQTYNTTSITNKLKQIIDITDTAALTVRKNGNTGDVFIVNTTNSKVLINGINVTPSSGDISETSFSASNTVSTATDVTGFSFVNGTVRSFKAVVSISIIATSNLYAIFDVYAIQKGTGWSFASNYLGDSTGIIFTITSTGQIQYTSGTVAGFVSNTIKFRAITTSI